MSTVYEILDDGLIIEKSKGLIKSTQDNFFANLRSTITENSFVTRGDWENYLRYDEDRWMEDKFGGDPSAKHTHGAKRAGTWKYSLLPKPYQSAKSVLSRALEKGIDVKDKGKTELENMIQGKVPVDDDSSTGTKNSNLHKFKVVWLKAKSYVNNMTHEEKASAFSFTSRHPMGL